MKGHKFLKVTGILMIIGGALAAILGIIAVLSVAALAYIASAHSEAGMLYASTILFLVSGIVELIAGIIGVLNAEKPQKAKACIVWGALVAVLSVAGTILGVAGGGDFSVFSLILGLVLPVLYIIGAVKNMQSANSVG